MRDSALDEVLLHVAVGEVRRLVQLQLVLDMRDGVAAFVRGVEDAAPVGETAVGRGEMHHFFRLQIERAHADDGSRDLLPIGADVLHGRATDAAGDAGETFDAGAVPLHRKAYHRVPAGARIDRDAGKAAAGALVGPL